MSESPTISPENMAPVTTISALAQACGRTFSVDKFGCVKAVGAEGGTLREQSVEALLLLGILCELQAMNGYLESIQNWGTGQQRG